METENFDLHELADSLGKHFPAIEALYLFGSRRYRTRSSRSDIDVLVKSSAFIKATDLRLFAEKECPALDLFIATGGRAVSCANDSYVEAESLESLIGRLEAVEFWNKATGCLEQADIDWSVAIPLQVEFIAMSVAAGTHAAFSYRWSPSVQSFFRQLEAEGIPAQPFMGSDFHELADFLAELTKKAVTASAKLNPRGKGLSIRLDDEYDFQNLFFLTVKPWLSSLAKEEVTVRYDGQEKSADFNLSKSRVVIELKYVKDANTKGQVVKTLLGLSDFYRMNANVKVLLFGIMVASNVDVDTERWERDYSTEYGDVIVRTFVVKLPPVSPKKNKLKQK
jgi:hypothetical protein